MDENEENSRDSKSDINKPFECDVCHKTYSTSVKLHYHKRTHKPKKFEISVCEHCNESFPTKKHLIAHRSKFHKVRISGHIFKKGNKNMMFTISKVVKIKSLNIRFYP